MRMTLQTDYALRVLIYLALRAPRSSTVNEIAEAYDISRNHLLKVALKLRNMGLLATARGRAGGVRLAIPAEQVNVGAVVRGFGETFPVVECMRAVGRGCVLSPPCRLKAIVREALGAYLDVFGKYTLADLTANRAELFGLLDTARAECASADAAA